MEGLLQAILQQGPVGQSGQFVVRGQVAKPLFCLLALGDVTGKGEGKGLAFILEIIDGDFNRE